MWWHGSIITHWRRRRWLNLCLLRRQRHPHAWISPTKTSRAVPIIASSLLIPPTSIAFAVGAATIDSPSPVIIAASAAIAATLRPWHELDSPLLTRIPIVPVGNLHRREFLASATNWRHPWQNRSLYICSTNIIG